MTEIEVLGFNEFAYCILKINVSTSLSKFLFEILII